MRPQRIFSDHDDRDAQSEAEKVKWDLYLQTPGVDGEIVGEYYAPHTRLARTTLAHQEDLSLLGLLDLEGGTMRGHVGGGGVGVLVVSLHRVLGV